MPTTKINSLKMTISSQPNLRRSFSGMTLQMKLKVRRFADQIIAMA
jgi:hypothetical protein